MALHRDMSVALLPVGTSNDFAAMCQMPPDATEALKLATGVLSCACCPRTLYLTCLRCIPMTRYRVTIRYAHRATGV